MIAWTLSACAGADESTKATEKDTKLVYCLDSSRSDDFISAAVALGAAERLPATGEVRVDKTDMTLVEWSKDQRRSKSFDRVCANLFAADPARPAASGSTDGVLALGGALLSVVIGGLLTSIIPDWRADMKLRKAEAVTLSRVAGKFTRAVHSYVSQWTDVSRSGRPPTDELDRSREALADLLAHAGSMNPRWELPRELGEQLRDGGLGLGISNRWNRSDQEKSETRAAALAQEADHLNSKIDIIVHAMKRGQRRLPTRKDEERKPVAEGK